MGSLARKAAMVAIHHTFSKVLVVRIVSSNLMDRWEFSFRRISREASRGKEAVRVYIIK